MKKLPIWGIVAALFLSVSFPTGVSAKPDKLVFSQLQSSPIQNRSANLVQHIYQKLGIEVAFINVPSLRSLEMSNAGKLDGEIFRIGNILDKYPNLIRVPTPLFELEGYAYSMNGTTYDRLEDIPNGVRIGIQRGVLWSENLVVGRKGVYRSKHVSELLNKLSKGELDVVFGVDIELLTTFRQHQYPGHLSHGKQIERLTFYHYLHKKYQDLITPVDQIIQRLRQEGVFPNFSGDHAH